MCKTLQKAKQIRLEDLTHKVIILTTFAIYQAQENPLKQKSCMAEPGMPKQKWKTLVFLIFFQLGLTQDYLDFLSQFGYDSTPCRSAYVYGTTVLLVFYFKYQGIS